MSGMCDDGALGGSRAREAEPDGAPHSQHRPAARHSSQLVFATVSEHEPRTRDGPDLDPDVVCR